MVIEAMLRQRKIILGKNEFIITYRAAPLAVTVWLMFGYFGKM